MKSLSVAQMREADRRCIQDLGIPGPVLMNSAGTAVFNEITGGRVGVVCGKGNNGGDGFVVARLARLAGYRTQVVLVADPDEITGDARIFTEVYARLGGEITSVTNEAELASAIRSLEGCAVLVDALLGTGIEGEVRGIYRKTIEAWPEVHTVAVDLPSGLNADTGEVCGCCVRAHLTVTFQFAKNGFANPAAQPYLGRLIVADIGIPALCADDEAWARLRGGSSS